MNIDHIIDTTLLKHPARILVEADLQVSEDEVFYYITNITVIELGGADVELGIGLDDLPPDAKRAVEEGFDDYITTNALELAAAEADYEADMAFDRWREEHDHE